MAHKTGRNEPCPCGSGRKYKHCCLAAQASEDLPWRRLRRVDDAMTDELMRFAARRFGEEYLDAAWDEFYLWEPPPTDAEGQPIDLGAAFVPWLLYCFEPDLHDDETPLEWPSHPVALTYLEERSARLPELEQRFLLAACEAPWSFLAVEAVEPGKGMQLRDLLTGEVHDAREALGSQQMTPGSVLFARVVSLEGISILLGCAPVVIPAQRQIEILDFREELAGEGGLLAPEQLREVCLEIREHYFELLNDLYHPIPPKLQNTDGESLVPCKLFFELACATEEAVAALRDLAAPGTENARDDDVLDDVRRDATGALRAASFSWLRAGNALHPEWENTVLGRIAIVETRLAAEVNSLARAEQIRAEIAARLGARVRFVRQRKQPIERMLAARRERPPSAADRHREEEHRRLAQLPEIRALAARYWESWTEQPIPALGGVSPRQAAETERGRERLEALLAGLEARADGQADPFTAPDVGALRRRIGLPPRPGGPR